MTKKSCFGRMVVGSLKLV